MRDPLDLVNIVFSLQIPLDVIWSDIDYMDAVSLQDITDYPTHTHLHTSHNTHTHTTVQRLHSGPSQIPSKPSSRLYQ